MNFHLHQFLVVAALATAGPAAALQKEINATQIMSQFDNLFCTSLNSQNVQVNDNGNERSASQATCTQANGLLYKLTTTGSGADEQLIEIGLCPADSSYCVTLDYPDGATLESCSATLSGAECNSCSLCDLSDGKLGITADCGNVGGDASITQCWDPNGGAVPTTGAARGADDPVESGAGGNKLTDTSTSTSTSSASSFSMVVATAALSVGTLVLLH